MGHTHLDPFRIPALNQRGDSVDKHAIRLRRSVRAEGSARDNDCPPGGCTVGHHYDGVGEREKRLRHTYQREEQECERTCSTGTP